MKISTPYIICWWFVAAWVFTGYVAGFGSENDCIDENCTEITSAEKIHVVPNINYDEFMKKRDSDEFFILLDVRPEKDYILRHIPGAASFPVMEMTKRTIEKTLIDKEVPIVVYCFSLKCSMSRKAAEKLLSQGYQAINFEGGLWEWLEKGNLVISGKPAPIDELYDEKEN